MRNFLIFALFENLSTFQSLNQVLILRMIRVSNTDLTGVQVPGNFATVVEALESLADGGLVRVRWSGCLSSMHNVAV